MCAKRKNSEHSLSSIPWSSVKKIRPGVTDVAALLYPTSPFIAMNDLPIDELRWAMSSPIIAMNGLPIDEYRWAMAFHRVMKAGPKFYTRASQEVKRQREADILLAASNGNVTAAEVVTMRVRLVLEGAKPATLEKDRVGSTAWEYLYGSNFSSPNPGNKLSGTVASTVVIDEFEPKKGKP